MGRWWTRRRDASYAAGGDDRLAPVGCPVDGGTEYRLKVGWSWKGSRDLLDRSARGIDFDEGASALPGGGGVTERHDRVDAIG
jgi:hypothetical protein